MELQTPTTEMSEPTMSEPTRIRKPRAKKDGNRETGETGNGQPPLYSSAARQVMGCPLPA